MKKVIQLFSIMFIFSMTNETSAQTNLQTIQNIQNLVGFWDFNKTDPTTGFYTAYSNLPGSAGNNSLYPLTLNQIGDAGRYNESNWPYSYTDAELTFNNSGPFGKALKINKGHVFASIQRSDFENTDLDISGREPFTFVVWVKMHGTKNNHLIAGIWDEGNSNQGWSQYKGRRQFAIFGGLNKGRRVMGHISTTGAASFPQTNVVYAQVRSIDERIFSTGSNATWHMMAMTYDPTTNLVKSYLDGEATYYHNPSAISTENTVYQYDSVPPVNPRNFEWPVFDARDFILKFGGYNVNDGNEVYEHFVKVDLKSSIKTITYGNKSRNENIANSKNYRIDYKFIRNESTVANSQGSIDISNSNGVSILNSNLQVLNGDQLEISLYYLHPTNGAQIVGSVIRREIDEGAPFTIGRALGIGGVTDKEKGSQLFIDGMAVYNRVLSDEELMRLHTFENLSCEEVNGTNASQITSSGAQINWNEIQGATYTVRHKLTGNSNWIQTSSNTNSLTLSSLLPFSSYDVEIEAICDNGAISPTINSGSKTQFITLEATTSNCNSSVKINLENKPVVASSIESFANREPENGFDGDLSTRWAANKGVNEWIYIDLGNNYSINKIDIDWAKSYGKSYRLEVLASGEDPMSSTANWELLIETVNVPCDGNNHCIIPHEFETKTGRYVRFYGLEKSQNWGYSFFEMDIYECQSAPTINCNTATAGKTVVASSYEGNNREAINAFDGDLNTRWAAAIGANEWIYVDLGNDYQVDQIDIDWGKAFGKQYRLEILPSGEDPNSLTSNWQLLTDTINIPCGLENHCMIEHQFQPKTGRYVRFYGVEQGKYWGYSFFEMIVHYCDVNGSAQRNSHLVENDEPILLEDSKWSIYPNPARQIVNIEFNELFINDSEPIRLYITDFTGKIIYEKTVFENQRIEVNVENFNDGIYLICFDKLNGKTNFDSKKFIIRH